MSKKRKQLIEEISADFHAIENKMHGLMMRGHKGGITHSQRFALFLISENKDASVKEIANRLCTTSSAATQLVSELAKQGFVLRKTNPRDRRELDLAISKRGRKQILEIKKGHRQMMSLLFSALSGKELEQFMKLNKKILSNI